MANIQSNKKINRIYRDCRFKHLLDDPRFRSHVEEGKKVRIGKRFRSVFEDSKFKLNSVVDKYGRRISQHSWENIKHFYEVDSSSETGDERIEKQDDALKEGQRGICNLETYVCKNTNTKIGDAADRLPISETLKHRLISSEIDYARGENRLITDSSSDDESSDGEIYMQCLSDEIVTGVDIAKESTKRLGVCNMNWDRIRAIDLMMLFSSFLPKGGLILSIKIYVSEFGKKRLEEEESQGPCELIEGGTCGVKYEFDSDCSDGNANLSLENIREYQLNRLRYYYAVLECDSITSADKIYEECDGLEYESSGTRLDLRFIPDDLTFDDDNVVAVCTKMPDINNYRPRIFSTTALQQSKVGLTWDETPIERHEITAKLVRGKLDDVSEQDLKKIVAYSSEEDDELNENEIYVKQDIIEDQSDKNNIAVSREESKKIKKEANDNSHGMEFTWEINKSKEMKKLNRRRMHINNVEYEKIGNKRQTQLESQVLNLNNNRNNNTKSKNILEEDEALQILGLQNYENDCNKNQLNANGCKNKLSLQNQYFRFNINDERFNAIYTSHHYNIDPTNGNYKNTQFMQRIVLEKLKRRNCIRK